MIYLNLIVLESLNQINYNMKKISLRDITDDILLLVRNNNISESEDLSRAQIHSWIKAYARKIWKEEKDKKKELARLGKLEWEDLIDDEFISKVETGPHELEDVESLSDEPTFTKVITEPLVDVLNNHESSILAVHDQQGEAIQYMNHIRRHYQYWRKYTFGELTAYYKDNGKVYVQGLVDKNQLKYVYILWLKENEVDDDEDDNDDDGPDEDDVLYPAWMIPPIKERIMKNELAFMLNRPSDDSNNATLASVKPHGPQDDEE